MIYTGTLCTVFLYVLSGETSVRDESYGDLVFCFKPKMAAPITDSGCTDSNAADVVRCLNALISLYMRSIAIK